jgi:phytanoyl-CoA hydroxylase
MIDVREYKKNGYLLLENFFEKEEIDLVRNQAKDIFTAQMARYGILGSREVEEDEFARAMFRLFEIDLQAFTNCGKQAQHLISLHRLSLDQRIAGVLEVLGLKFPNISTRPVLYFNSERLAKREVYWKLAPHQDWRSMQGSLDSAIVWIPLVDIDRALGALEIVPSSHRWGLLPANIVDGYGHLQEPVDMSQAKVVEIKKGDVLFFSAFSVHQSGVNVTNSIRWSCHFRYNNLREETFVARGFPHPYIYRPQEELITENFPDRRLVSETFK